MKTLHSRPYFRSGFKHNCNDMLRLTVVLLLGVLAHQSFADEPEAIVGGSSATPTEFPYQCGLRNNGGHLCGCSILSQTKILTAAHCIHGMVSPPYSNFYVVTGSIYSYGGTEHAVKSVKMHPGYQPYMEKSWVNDIAVITLQAPIQFDIYRQPVKLASSAPRAGTQCILSGWGQTSTKGPTSRYLLKMITTLQDNNVCMYSHNRDIYYNQVCALARRGSGACSGDSGGPLVCNGELCGVTSWVVPCALGLADVYTSVFHHLDFIKGEMAN